ncbi:NAD(P)/FAD-dependent oxidoreductase [Sabulicella rubraurantiaca]|uniref:NAD(P)/FAD-dependent oxidoreductase n=1 Tax=Sabulicella rubraurantiaca TaxID=2811429 RepID=UPI001A95C136|nr:NAD(P)/FAD-dependent oxidoreductase [Sabulicella rubraurantiaca]
MSDHAAPVHVESAPEGCARVLRPAPAVPGRPAGPPRVVVLGAGFAGLTAARALGGAPVELVVVDPRDHHLFQPLLYQVATAALSPADIAMPIRAILGRRRNTEVVLGEVIGIDKVRRRVRLPEREIAYDVLVVATGAHHAYFGRDEWAEHAPGLKRLEDAIDIRRRVLLAFERAETATGEEERRRLLTFVVVGDGPTGVEMAGAIAELAKVALARDFHRIDPRGARVLLVEGGLRLLAAFAPESSARAKAALEALGVEVRLGEMVTAFDSAGVALGGVQVSSGTVVWAAGVAASPAARWLGVEPDLLGRVPVGPDLTLRGYPEIFVLGNTSAVAGPDGRALPSLAPVAKRQGEHAARAIRAALESRRAPKPFRYRHAGNLATIGRGRALAEIAGLRLYGRFAWFLWGAVHIAFLIGFRNRAALLLDWLWAYATSRRNARLITSERMG